MRKLFLATNRLDEFIARRWLILGYFVLLTGLFWVDDSSRYTKLYYALMAAPALISLVTAPRYLLMILREPIVIAFMAFAAWLLLTLLWTRSTHDVEGLAKRPLYVFMMFAACTIAATKDQQLLLKTLRASAIVAALAAFISLMLFFSDEQSDRMVGIGALSNPLLSSHVFGFFCIYWITSWLTKSEHNGWLPIVCIAPLLVAILATGSRTPLMALALTSVWMLLMLGRRALYLIVAGSAIAAVGFLLLPDVLLQRGLSFRPQLWSEAIQQAGERLWIGHGYDTKFTFAIEGVGRILSDPHNVELAVLLESGVVGLALWLLIYAFAVLRCLEQQHNAKFQLASALAIYGLAAGLTEGSNFLSRPNENWFLIWIPLSLIAALSINQRRQEAL